MSKENTNTSLIDNNEEIYWQGEPVVSLFNVKYIIFYILPGVILLLFWSGKIELDNDFFQNTYALINDGTMVRWGVFLLIISMMLSPVIQWFFYYKRMAYVFTEKRAIAYYKESKEIAFQIEASDIPNMRRSYRRDGLISLYKYIQEETAEPGATRIVRVGFEGIPAYIPDFYQDAKN